VRFHDLQPGDSVRIGEVRVIVVKKSGTRTRVGIESGNAPFEVQQGEETHTYAGKGAEKISEK